MARRPSLFDYAEAFSKLPPYVTGPLGLVGYLGLHYVATRPMPQAKDLADPHAPAGLNTTALNHEFTAIIFHGFSMVFQWVIPFVMICSIVMWTVRHFQRKRMQSLADNAITPESMANLSWQEFEEVVCLGFAKFGFNAELTQEGADGGIDIVLRRNGQRFLVQCKHWKQDIPVNIVREMYGVMLHDAQQHPEGAHGIYIVTSGSFSAHSLSFAQGKPIWLYNGEKLRTLLRAGKSAASATGKIALDRVASGPSSEGPACPTCGGETTMRRARKGPNSGNRFWGCARYPSCSGIVPID